MKSVLAPSIEHITQKKKLYHHIPGKTDSFSLLTGGKFDRQSTSHSDQNQVSLVCEKFGLGTMKLKLIPFPPYQPYAPVTIEKDFYCGHGMQNRHYKLKEVLLGKREKAEVEAKVWFFIKVNVD